MPLHSKTLQEFFSVKEKRPKFIYDRRKNSKNGRRPQLIDFDDDNMVSLKQRMSQGPMVHSTERSVDQKLVMTSQCFDMEKTLYSASLTNDRYASGPQTER